jgi:hypothetical protein
LGAPIGTKHQVQLVAGS